MNRLLGIGGLIVGLVIGTLAIAAVGAQEDTPTPAPTADEDKETRRDRYQEKLAENLGISVDELEAAIKQTHLDLIDEALAEGRITEEQAAEARERVENGQPPFFLHPRGGAGHGPIGHGPIGRGIHWFADSVKEILGLEDGAIRKAFADGKSIADLAEEQGVSVDDLKAQVLEAAKAKLDDKVADGDITQEQADNIYQRLENNIDNFINFVPPASPLNGEGLRFGGPEEEIAPFVPLPGTDEAEIDA